MKEIRNIYISGLGAVGAAYASKLYEMNPGCVKVIVDRERIRRYSESGIIINGKTIPFTLVAPDDGGKPADLIIVAVKHHHLEQAIMDIKPFVGEGTVILSLLNGIVSEEIIGREIGMEKMLYAMCVGIDAVRLGTETRFANLGKIVFGEKSNTTLSPRVAAVKELFEKAGIACSIPEDMLRMLWWKFMMNVGLNQTSAVLKAPYGVYQQVEEAIELMKQASREVVALSEKAGINLREEEIEDYIKIIRTLAPEGKTSMLQDVEAGRKTEVEIFAGTVIELGQKYGVATPVNDILFKMIRTLEKQKLQLI